MAKRPFPVAFKRWEINIHVWALPTPPIRFAIGQFLLHTRTRTADVAGLYPNVCVMKLNLKPAQGARQSVIEAVDLLSLSGPNPTQDRARLCTRRLGQGRAAADGPLPPPTPTPSAQSMIVSDLDIAH